MRTSSSIVRSLLAIRFSNFLSLSLCSLSRSRSRAPPRERGKEICRSHRPIIVMTDNHSSGTSALPRLPPSAAASADAAAAAGRALWGRLGAAAGGVRSLAAELAADVIETAEDLAKEVRKRRE